MENLKGLNKHQVLSQRDEFGYNEIPTGKQITAKDIFLRQFKNIMVYILFFAIILSLILSKIAHIIIISIILSIVVLLGFFQEYKASKEMNALKKMLVPNCIVIRNSKKEVISSKDVVPEDILFLSAGDKVPADGVVLKQTKFEVNESAITGESEPVKKGIFMLDHEESIIDSTKISDKNRVYMSSYVTQGNAYVKVTHTGKNTEFGKIANLMQTQETENMEDLIANPIKNFTKFAFFMVFITLFIILFQIYIQQGSNFFNYLFQGEIFIILSLVLALLVSGIPEGLPVVVTISLAKGMKRMSSKNAIVNKMDSLKDLGKVSFICSDKTGTITKNEMTVKHFYFNGKSYDVKGNGYNNKGEIVKGLRKVNYEEIDLFIDSISLCNDAQLKDATEVEGKANQDIFYYDIVGSSTESSLLVLGQKSNVKKEELNKKYNRIEEAPFSSERKMMSVLCNYPLKNKLEHNYQEQDNSYQENNEKAIFVKGGIDVILDYCNRIYDGGIVKNLDQNYLSEIKDRVNALTKKTYRVLGVALREDDTDKELDELENNNLIFLGYVAIIDPARDEVKKSIKIAHQAGIEVMMITGDNKNTAQAIAKEVGILDDSNYYEVLEGSQINSMSDEELYDIVENLRVCARAKPEHKLRIVNALQKKDHVVSMTGDGVNDSPALKKADIGVAVGSGTEVAKEASDIIIKDDNFSTIVLAIEEGRHIFENLQKFSSYQFSCNIAQIMIIFLSIVFKFPVLLTALQILFMNLVTDDMPAISLALNPESKDIMTWKPKKRIDGIFNKRLTSLMIISGLIMTFFTFMIYYKSFILESNTLLYSRTVSLITLILMQVLFATSFRSFRKLFFKIKFNENKWLLNMSFLTLIFTSIVVYSPINVYFEVTAININNFVLPLIYSVIGLFILDISKIIIMKGFYPLNKKIKHKFGLKYV